MYPYGLTCPYIPFTSLQNILKVHLFRFINLECPLLILDSILSDSVQLLFNVRFSVICVPNTQWEKYSSLSPTQFPYSSVWYVSYSAFHYLFTFLCPLLKFEFFKDNDSLPWHFMFTPITVFFFKCYSVSLHKYSEWMNGRTHNVH